jgi:epoxyqueuosine reductase QueG
MKSEKHLYKKFAEVLQKEMNSDMIEMVNEEQRRDYPHKGLAKIQPAYMLGDTFQDKHQQQAIHNDMKRAQEREAERHLIQSDEIKPGRTGRIYTVMPNE